MSARRVFREALLLAAVVALALAGLVTARAASDVWSAWRPRFVRYALLSWFASDKGGLIVPILLAVALSYSLRLVGALRRGDDEALPRLGALVAASMAATVVAAAVRVVRLRGEVIAALDVQSFRALGALEAEATALAIAGGGALILALLLGGVGGAVARRRGGGSFALAAVAAATVIGGITAFAVARCACADLATSDPCADPDARTRILYEAFAAHSESIVEARRWLLGTAIVASIALVALGRRDRAPAPGRRALYAGAAMFGLGLAAFGWTRAVASDAEHPPPPWSVSEPAASDGSEACIDGPLLSLQGGRFSLDGVALAGESIAKGLADKRALWQLVQPHNPFPGNLLAAIPEDASMATLAPVLEVARAAGYPKIIALRPVPTRRWRTRTLGVLTYGPRVRCTPISSALEVPNDGTWGSFVDRASRSR